MLVSLYIENHPYLFNGEPKTLNFGGKYIYRFRKKDTKVSIDREENSQFINGFFDLSYIPNVNVSLLSAIVGENGTGKSSIIDIITSIIEQGDKMDFRYVLIFENSNQVYIKSNLTKPSEYESSVELNVHTEVPYSTFYYSPHIDQIDTLNISEFNISTKRYLLDDYYKIDESAMDKNYILGIDTHSGVRRIEFTSSPLFSELNNILRFPNIDSKYGYLKIANIYINQSSNILQSKIIFEDFLEEISRHKYALRESFSLADVNYTKKSQLKFTFLEKTIKQLYSVVFNPGYLGNFTYSTDHINVNNTLEILFGYLEEFYFSNGKDKAVFKKYKSSLLDLKKLLYKEIDNSEEIDKEGFKIEYHKILDIINAETKVINELMNLSSISLFLNRNFVPSRVIVFDPNRKLSSGEIAFFSLFSNLHNILKYKRIEKQRILFFIDEGDLGFHPQWKKKYINLLLQSLPYFFSKIGSKVELQIIITTHDPLTLSDFPSSNAIFLNKNGVLEETIQSTFGANISELLANSFFINDGLIGDFAKSKITEVIEWINKVKDKNLLKGSERGIYLKELKEKESIIKLIDERVLRIKLNEMISELEENDEFYNDQIEEEIERLKKLKRKPKL